MTDAEISVQSWHASTLGWLESIERGDINRTMLLDEPMLRLASDVTGLKVADIGCGEGRFCRMLSDRGATTTGVDPTSGLLAAAKEKDPSGTYLEAFAEVLPLEDQAYDLVISYLVLIDVTDHRKAISEMARILKPGGRILVANLQSFATTVVPNPWVRDAEAKKTFFAVDNYFEERPTTVSWGKISIINWHRTMESYMSAFLECGLILKKFLEPRPSAEAISKHPSMIDEERVPIFYVMEWAKP